MNSILKGAFLISSTAIGSGMLSLPIVLAKFGMIYSILIIISIWLVTYYTSLIVVELTLQSKKNMTLSELGYHYSGYKASIIGMLSIQVISYALLSVFIYGGSSVFQSMIEAILGYNYALKPIIIIYTLVSVLILSTPAKYTEIINRLLFFAMMLVIGILIFGLAFSIDWLNIPDTGSTLDLTKLSVAIPVLLTSFGFQTIFPILVTYCDRDPSKAKKACFLGTLIPTIVYITWTCIIFVLLQSHSPEFYEKMKQGGVEVGSMVHQLSGIAQWHYMKLVIWWLSVFAIITSVIGIGMGLINSWMSLLAQRIEIKYQKSIAILLSFAPPLIIALIIPDAFIKVLSFAGMILVIIAIILPLYLLQNSSIVLHNYDILKYRSIRLAAFLFGISVIIMEMINIIFRGS